MAEAYKSKNNGILFSFSRCFRFPNMLSRGGDSYASHVTVEPPGFSTGLGLTLQMKMLAIGNTKSGKLVFVLDGKLDSSEKVKLCDMTISIVSDDKSERFQTEVYPGKIISSTPQFQKLYEHVSNYQEQVLYYYEGPQWRHYFTNTFSLSKQVVNATVEGKVIWISNDSEEANNSKSVQTVPELKEETVINECNVIQTTKCVEGICLSELLETPQYSDVDICVKGKNFSVHKNILCARSKGLAEMIHDLESKNGNNPVNIITINDFCVEVVHEALFFMYTGTCSKITEIATSLLAFADKFKMDDLKLLCETEIQSTVTVASVCPLLDLADKCNAPNLKLFCNNFVKNNSKEVTKSESWMELKKSNPIAVMDLLDMMLHGNI